MGEMKTLWLIFEKIYHSTHRKQYSLNRILLKKYLRLNILLDYSFICSTVSECLLCMPCTRDSKVKKTDRRPPRKAKTPALMKLSSGARSMLDK